MTNTALILVDLQNDFMPGGALAVTDGDQTVALANKLMPRYDIVVATQDWHPAEHASFVDNHPGKNLFDVVDLNGIEQVLWPQHCVQHTPGAAFHPALKTEAITKVFPKGTNTAIDSYSGFFDNDHQQATGMGDWLQQQKVTTVDIIGLATDYCVKFTVLDAQALGFTTRLLLPACRGVDLQAGDIDQALAEMRQAGVEIVHNLNCLFH